MKLIIETTDNGFIVTTKYQDISNKTVFEHKNQYDKYHEIHTLRLVFLHIQSQLDLFGTDYDEEILRPLIIKGPDFDGELTKKVKETKEYLKYIFENGQI
jgi:hypothetical protein